MSKAPAADYALEIIEFFAANNSEMGITDISNALNINKNAVSRVLDALLEKNWIYMSDTGQKKYRLTLRPFSLISASMQNNNIVKIATPMLENLNNILGDSVYLGIKNNRNILYLIHCDSKKDVRINGCAGGEYPLNCSAPGKILLGYSENDEILNYFESYTEKRTDNTITDYKGFITESEKIKKDGYAFDNEEFAKGIICIAVPVFDSNGNTVASIGISSLTIYDNIDSLVNKKLPLLKETANEISLSLGGEIKL